MFFSCAKSQFTCGVGYYLTKIYCKIHVVHIMFSYNFIVWYIMEHFWQLVEQEEAVCGYEVYIEAPIYPYNTLKGIPLWTIHT